MDHFALHTDELYVAREENRMNRNFMGYTDLPSDTMIGIGVSSISELLNGYHQNVKTLKEYTTLINDGKIPTLRAHRLSDSEMRTRLHIKNLMCHLKSPVDDMQFMDTELLEEMIGEKILEKNETHWQILPAGLPFIRNIAAAFDPQFQRAQNQKRFSGAI
ncbi:MAG: hypothetical protein IPN29_08155 [Saprospiraceae bacterium]|nr:hypothetical protein [Saprospiraceae bacterium]